MKLKHMLSTLLVSLVFFGCGTPEKLANTRLAQTLRLNGYSAYTPFRTGDYPGTVFVYARSTDGRTIELTLSPWSQTFKADTGDLFPPDGQPVEIGERITETNSFSGSFAAEILKPILNLSNAVDYLKAVNIEFGSDQRKHVMSLATLERFRNKFQDDTKAALKRFKDRGELSHVFLIMETFSIDKLSVELVAKSGFETKVSLDKVKAVGSAKLEATGGSDRQFKLTFSKPMLIGYKAIKFTDAILSDVVSPPRIETVFVTPAQIDKIKE